MKIKVEMIIESSIQAAEDNSPSELEQALKDDVDATMNCADLFTVVGDITYTNLGE